MIQTCSGNSSPSDKQAAGKNSTNTNGIVAVLEQKCTGCHGTNGAAGIANAANLQTSNIGRTAIISVINNGWGGMPSFSSQLTKKEAADLANYILTLRK